MVDGKGDPWKRARADIFSNFDRFLRHDTPELDADAIGVLHEP